jgi:hypothetical protein
MFELFLLMISMGVHSASGDASQPAETRIAALPQSEDAAPAIEAQPTTPTFLAPQPDAAQTDSAQPATPTFLAPQPSETPAQPSFLAPKPEEQAATPLFLTPQPEPAAPEPQNPLAQAEPQVATGRFTTALEVKPILSATKTAWVAVREYGGQDLLYVTHLWAWRCGLLEMKIGINGNPPEVWPMPDCHLDQPSPGAILESDGLPYREFGLNSVHLIEVVLTYDDLSTESQKFSRQGMPIQ